MENIINIIIKAMFVHIYIGTFEMRRSLKSTIIAVIEASCNKHQMRLENPGFRQDADPLIFQINEIS